MQIFFHNSDTCLKYIVIFYIIKASIHRLSKMELFSI